MSKRALSNLLAVLLLSVIVASMIAMTVTLHTRFLEESRRAAAEIAESLSEAVNPPLLSLVVENGMLVLEAHSPIAVSVDYIVLVYENSSVVARRIGEKIEGYWRTVLLDRYSCEKTRVVMILRGGQAIAWNPERDPRVGHVPPGWSGWFTCGIQPGSRADTSIPGVRLAGVIESRVDPVSGHTVIEAESPRITAADFYRIQFSLSIEIETSYNNIRYKMLPQGSWSSWQASQIEVARFPAPDERSTLRIRAHVREDVVSEAVRLRSVWLTISGLEQAVYRGRINVTLPTASYRVSYPLERDAEFKTILVLAYSPGGEQTFDTRCSNDASAGVFTVEGRATGYYETPGPIYLLFNGFAGSVTSVRLLVNLTIEEIVVYRGEPARVRIEGSETLRVRIATLEYTPPDPNDYITTTIYRAMRDSMHRPERARLGVCSSQTSCSYLAITSTATHAWSPIDVFEIELRPDVGSALREWDRSYQCLRHVSIGRCHSWRIWGSSSSKLLPASWTIPFIIEVQLADGRKLLLTSSPSSGEAVLNIRGSGSQRGYTMTVFGADFTVEPRAWWIPASVDWQTLRVYARASLWASALDQPTSRQSYYIASAPTRAGSESILVWIS